MRELVTNPTNWVLLGGAIVLVAGFVSQIQQSGHDREIKEKIEAALVGIENSVGNITGGDSIPIAGFTGSNFYFKHLRGAYPIPELSAKVYEKWSPRPGEAIPDGFWEPLDLTVDFDAIKRSGIDLASLPRYKPPQRSVGEFNTDWLYPEGWRGNSIHNAMTQRYSQPDGPLFPELNEVLFHITITCRVGHFFQEIAARRESPDSFKWETATILMDATQSVLHEQGNGTWHKAGNYTDPNGIVMSPAFEYYFVWND
ncbi:MAG: hypothetical protein AAF515_02005 [Pseudomonadota bacterium]